jgi:hypothetical protein
VNRFCVFRRLFWIALVFAFAANPCFSERVPLHLRLQAGQTFFYHIDFRTSRNMETESRVASPQFSPAADVNASGLLHVEVVDASPSGFRVKTYYSERNASPPAAPSSSSHASPPSTADKMVEVSIAANGTASQIKGLDQLSPVQQFAWNDWLGRFTSSAAFPKTGIAAGQKWTVFEPEPTPSPIAGLTWTKKYQYVRDEPCKLHAEATDSNVTTPAPQSQICAVVLVRATLRQRSSPKNSTPQDYKLRDLSTRGKASGQNETILYISRSTGVLIRSTEDADQSMEVVVALTDGTNQVQYSLSAKSHSDIFLLPDSPQNPH